MTRPSVEDAIKIKIKLPLPCPGGDAADGGFTGYDGGIVVGTLALYTSNVHSQACPRKYKNQDMIDGEEAKFEFNANIAMDSMFSKLEWTGGRPIPSGLAGRQVSLNFFFYISM